MGVVATTTPFFSPSHSLSGRKREAVGKEKGQRWSDDHHHSLPITLPETRHLLQQRQTIPQTLIKDLRARKQFEYLADEMQKLAT